MNDSPDPDARELDDQQAVVDLAGRLAEALPGFTWTVGPDPDGRTSILVDAEDEPAAREHFDAHPLRVDGDRVLPVAVRPGR